MADRTLVALATYNEMENLPELTAAILRTLPNGEILVVDDNSPDGTGRWAAEFARTEPRFSLLERPGKSGLGSAVLAAFDFAVRGDYDYLINLDADFSHPVEKIPELLAVAETKGIDVVIGSRYVPGGKVVGWPMVRRVMSRAVNAYARLLLGLKTKDNSGAFRCYRVSALRRLNPTLVRSRGYSFFEEILFRLARTGATFAEVPITFTDRIRGVSKIDKKEAFAALILLFRVSLERLSPRRPDRVHSKRGRRPGGKE